MKDLKVIFFGTPLFSVPILEELIKKCNVIGVVTQPDRLVGRKKILTFSKVKEKAIEHNIKVFTPVKLKNEYEEILKLNPDIIITCAYGQIVPKEVLDYPKYGCINVHGSLLPKYRGGAPIQRCIMNNEEKTGITIMYMDVGLDTGDMISKKEINIDVSDNYDSLSEKLSILGRDLLIDTLPSIIDGTCNRIKQDDNLSTYASIITRSDERLDFNDNTINIYNKIRALSTVPSCYSILDNKSIKVYNSRIGNSNSNGEIGEIINVYKDGIGIKTKDGEIILTDIQIEGKNRMLVKDYFNGIDKNSLLGKKFKEV